MYIKASTLMLHNIRGAPICTKRSLFGLGVGTMYLTAKSSYMYAAKAILKHDNHIVHRDSRLLRLYAGLYMQEAFQFISKTFETY